MAKLAVLRLDHRIQRDHRMTTHVGLVARAFGAEVYAYTGDKDSSFEESLRDVIRRWGGNMSVEHVSSSTRFINAWKGITIHLTMYGEHHKKTVETIQNHLFNENILVVVGGAKVPPKIYELADFNTAVGLQPHSEISALGIFLNDLLGSDTLYQHFPSAMFELPEGAKATRKDRYKGI